MSTVFFSDIEEKLHCSSDFFFFRLKSFSTVRLNVLKTGGFPFEVGVSVENEFLDFLFITLIKELIKCDNKNR